MSPADEEVFDNEERDCIRSFIKQKDSTIWQTRLHDILNRGYSSGRLLDIGCNYGFFLGVCEPHFETYGIDISRYAISKAKNYAPRSKIVCCDAEENIPFAEETFDVVTMFDTLEHIKNYEDTLREVYRILKCGGILALATPNRWSLNSLLFGRDYWLKADRSHVVLFSRRTLRESLLRAGFSRIEIRTINLLHFLGDIGKRDEVSPSPRDSGLDIAQDNRTVRTPAPVLRRLRQLRGWVSGLPTPWGANLYTFARKEQSQALC